MYLRRDYLDPAVVEDPTGTKDADTSRARQEVDVRREAPRSSRTSRGAASLPPGFGNRRTLLAVVLLLGVAVAGAVVTAYLGEKARQEIIRDNEEALTDISLHLEAELLGLERTVKTLSGSPLLRGALRDPSSARLLAEANEALDRYNATQGASVTYLMDATGRTVASSNRQTRESFVGHSYAFRPYFQLALQGKTGLFFALGITSGKRGCYVAQAVRSEEGRTVGVAVMKKDLDALEYRLARHIHCYLASPEGIVFLSSRPEAVLKSLWPVSADAGKRLSASQQFGPGPFPSLFGREFRDRESVALEGKTFLAARAPIAPGGWFLVRLADVSRISLYRTAGIAGTVLIVIILAGLCLVIHQTERSHRALRESEQRLANIVDFLPDATLVIDRERRVILWNKAMEEMTGVAAEEIIGRGDFAYTIPFYGERRPMLIDFALEPRDEMKERYRDLLREGQTVTGEAFIPLLRGSERYLLGKASQLKDLQGRTIGAIETIRDITDRRRMEQLSLTLTNSVQTGLYIVQDDRIAFVNPFLTRCFGYAETEFLGFPVSRFILPEDLETVRECARAMLRGERMEPYEYRIRDREGRTRWVLESVTSIHYGGKPAVLGNLTDITARKEMEVALQRSEERHRAIIGQMEEGYYETDLKGVISFVNPSLCRMFGYAERELLGRPYQNLMGEETARQVRATFRRVFISGEADRSSDWELEGRDGRRIVVAASVTLIRDAAGRPAGFRGILRDITERKQREELITHMALHDTLTGLPNRAFFRDSMALALAQAERKGDSMALLVMDLDRFKDINDTLGHAAGDDLLRAAADRLRRCVRKGDMVARLGGDEFVVLLPDFRNPETLESVILRIMEDFRTPFVVQGGDCTVTISLGVAVYPGDGGDPDTLFRKADAALYEAKQGGRNRRCYAGNARGMPSGLPSC